MYSDLFILNRKTFRMTRPSFIYLHMTTFFSFARPSCWRSFIRYKVAWSIYSSNNYHSLSIIKNNDTFLQYFIKVMKRSLQNFARIYMQSDFFSNHTCIVSRLILYVKYQTSHQDFVPEYNISNKIPRHTCYSMYARYFVWGVTSWYYIMLLFHWSKMIMCEQIVIKEPITSA